MSLHILYQQPRILIRISREFEQTDIFVRQFHNLSSEFLIQRLIHSVHTEALRGELLSWDKLLYEVRERRDDWSWSNGVDQYRLVSEELER